MSRRDIKWLNVLLTVIVLVMGMLFVCIIHTDRRVDKLAREPVVPQKIHLYGETTPPETMKSEVVQIGYDFNYLCRVITAEAGTNWDLCMGVAQCLFNACQREGWHYSPTQVLEMYGYTGPADWILEEAEAACVAVFVDWEVYEPVGNALYFYAPRYVDSRWHESQSFVVEIEGVRFFEPVE